MGKMGECGRYLHFAFEINVSTRLLLDFYLGGDSSGDFEAVSKPFPYVGISQADSCAYG